MPEVNPTITGFGMKRITPPSCANPIASSMQPAISVATCSPEMPYWAVTPASTTMNAPVGPGDLHSRPAEQRSREPGDDRRVESLFRLRAGSDRERHCERQSDDADDHARDDVAPDLATPEQSDAVGLEESDHRRTAL
ncbi:MAG: hypothetical protein WDZ66_09240 [Steroidobacteraceae bacterium]